MTNDQAGHTAPQHSTEQPRDDLLPEAEQAAGGQDPQEPLGGGGQVLGQAASNQHLQGTIQKVRKNLLHTSRT